MRLVYSLLTVNLSRQFERPIFLPTLETIQEEEHVTAWVPGNAFVCEHKSPNCKAYEEGWVQESVYSVQPRALDATSTMKKD